MMDTLKQQLKRFSDDERGVSPVVGFVLIFALIMIVFTLYQSSVVPAQNEEIEFEHSRTTEGQMEQLSAAFVSTGPEDPPKAVPLQLGVQYPNRVFGINPGTPVGTLNSTGPHAIELASDGGSEGFSTSFINYLPNYNLKTQETQYSIEHGMLVKDYSRSSATRLASSGALFSADGETVNLNLINGSVSASEMSTVVTTDNVDTHEINVTSNSTTLTLPTTLEEDEWERILYTEGTNYIPQVDDHEYLSDSSEIKINLKNGTEVDLSKVTTGDTPNDGENEIEMEPQITNITGTSINATLGNSTELSARTTDIFGSGLPDIDVNFQVADGGGSVTPSQAVSGENGEAAFTYTPDSSDAGNTVEVVANVPNGSGPNSSVTFKLNYPTPESEDGAGGGSGNVETSNFDGSTHPAFDIHLEPTVNMASFSITAKNDLSGTTETVSSHNFLVYTTPEGSLEKRSDTPLKLDGTVYEFDNGPKPVTDSRVQLERFEWDPGVTLTGIADSPEEADLVVTFIAEDGSEYPVYITAEGSGG